MTDDVVLGRNTREWNRIVRSGVAGGIAGCVAKTVVAPLDRVKILFQTSSPEFAKYSGSLSGMANAVGHIYRANGIRGLFQGHSATLLRIFPYAGIKFMAYDQLHAHLMPTRAQETNVKRFIAGASAGVTSVLFTYPLELIRVRLAVEPHISQTATKPLLWRAVSHIYYEGTAADSAAISKSPTANRMFQSFPVLKFYRGFSATIIGMVPYAGTSFLVWGFLRSHFLPPPVPADGKSRQKKPRLHPVLDLTLGGIAGAVSQTASYPFEVVRRRMQVGGRTKPDRWLRWGETVQSIWTQRGWRGFFVGLSIGYIKVVPMTAVSYMTWEVVKQALEV